MKTNSDGSIVAVSVSDQGTPLTKNQIAAIRQCQTRGLVVGGRAWGLALARYVALNVGGRLDVELTESGNCVTLHLPVEQS